MFTECSLNVTGQVTTDYGTKTNMAIVTVANGKLYNLNVQYGQNGYYGETSPELVATIKKVLSSFTILPV
jgi:hypothetical protein